MAVTVDPRGFHGIRSQRLHTVGLVSARGQGLGSVDTGYSEGWGPPLPPKLAWAFPD